MANGLVFKPDIAEFSALRTRSSLTILSGGNNSGKSAVLKALKQRLGKTAYLVFPSRFYHIHQISTQDRNPREIDELENQFHNSYYRPDINHEQNFLDLGRVIANLSDKDRETLFQVCSELIGSSFSLKKIDPENELSMRYIDMDGQNLGLGSTGTRLLMTLIGICLDRRFDTLLIDEPELGLSPKVQNAFAEFLQDEEKRRRIFPHLSSVYLATHSHIFLDRKEPKNNFVISKDGLGVSITQIETVSELHRLQFNLLGNSLEKMSLPSAILIVEGVSDYEYIKRVVELKLPDKRITVVPGNGDPKRKVHEVKMMLGNDLQRSPYADRLFIVVDSVHQSNLEADLRSMGISQENLVIWSRNGIEYLYPQEIMSEIYSISSTSLEGELTIAGDIVTVREISHRKTELSRLVISRLEKTTAIPKEVQDKLISPLLKATS